jgi:phytoene synthase
MIFYHFCRAVDDVADDPALPPAEKRDLLARWKNALTRHSDLPPALAALIQHRELDPNLLREIIDGVEMDIEPQLYETFDDLRAYCWRVACAVGLVSIKIFGCQSPASTTYAEHLGYALQLTNILRDVGEDAALGRVYLPLEDLRHFGISEASLLAGNPTGDFTGLMKLGSDRARKYFHLARTTLPAEDARALIPATAMQAIYEKILHRMTTDNFRVFQKRYRVPAWEKTILLARSLLLRA